MSVPSHVLVIVSGILFCFIFFAACVSTTIGNVSYSGDGLTLTLSHDGEASAGFVQVTVYEIKNNEQKETDVLFAPLALKKGENTVFIPGSLEPGQYKLYIYLIQDGERKAATIRDLVVN
ncbi:MAG: hypothetical protein WC379_14230 [Methanoregula sp.]|jgi:hypothetical protein